jgi:DNA-binding response OmpR family regulator
MVKTLSPDADGITIGPLQILPREHLVRADGRTLMLSTRELGLLTELARREDRIVAREDLFALVTGRSTSTCASSG